MWVGARRETLFHDAKLIAMAIWAMHGYAWLGWQVNWQVYVHYSGLQSYTKGLLLVDSSGGSVRQMLELTSEEP